MNDLLDMLQQSNISAQSVLGAFIDRSHDLIACNDINGNYLFCNAGYAKYIGYDNPQDLIGKNIAEVFSQDSSQLIQDQHNKALKEQAPLGLDLCEISLENQKRFFHKQKIPLLNKDTTAGILTIYRDITEIHMQRTCSETRAQLIMAINLATRKLIPSTSEDFEKLARESMLNVGLSLNACACYVVELCEYGQTPSWHSPKILYKWQTTHSQPAIYNNDIKTLLQKLLSNKNCYLIHDPENEVNNHFLERVQLKRLAALPLCNNSQVWGALVFESNTLDNPWDNNIFEALELCAEMTAVILHNRHTQLRLEQSNRKSELAMLQAERANKSKTEFLAHMSHEIRTPLNSVLGFCEIMERETERDDHRQMLSVAVQSARSLLRILNDILDFSRMEAGKLTIKPEPYNLADGIHTVQRMFLESALEKRLQLSINTEGLCENMFELDGARIRQVLINLISNAIKFTDEGSVKITASSKPAHNPQQHDINITVTDTGRGVPSEKQMLLFKAFEQINPEDSLKHGGSGLGLAICNKLVKAMGGSFSYDQPEGMGSRFGITLHNIKSCNVQTQPETICDAVFTDLKVIVADDEEHVCDILRRFLFFMDITNIRMAENGEQAYELYKQEPADLIIIDEKMPIMNGAKAIGKIKAHEMEQEIKPAVFIGITALPQGDEASELEKAACDAVFFKPLDIDEISKIMQQLFPDKLGAAQESAPLPVETAQTSIDQRHHDAFLKEWDHLSKTMAFNDLLSFAEKIANFSENFNLRKLNQWAGRLKKQTSVFDMKKLPDTMKLFPQILQEMKVSESAHE